ncbi:MAG TPA: hypothetical protein PLI73_06940 [Candidatus Cloacimonadota bacterium]|nr:hypothetical protein [Candidatus Cloacimonadota bacterium]
MDQEKMNQIHNYFASNLFNQSWDLLLKEGRTSNDEEVLLDTAHSSLYHWRQIGEPINILRGVWMLAHVYTMLGHREEAMLQAQTCLRLAEEQQVKDWDLAYAYSAMARAAALNEDKALFEQWFAKAKTAGSEIREEGDKNQFMSDLNDGHWFGMC